MGHRVERETCRQMTSEVTSKNSRETIRMEPEVINHANEYDQMTPESVSTKTSISNRFREERVGH